MKRSKRPLALAPKGEVRTVPVDPTVYARMAERLDAIEGIHCGLVQVKKGLGRPAEEIFDDIERALTRL